MFQMIENTRKIIIIRDCYIINKLFDCVYKMAVNMNVRNSDLFLFFLLLFLSLINLLKK